MVVHLVSIDGGLPKEGLMSAISAVIVYDDSLIPGFGIFLRSLALQCGNTKYEWCANFVLPEIDRGVENLRKSWSDPRGLNYFSIFAESYFPLLTAFAKRQLETSTP